MPKTSQMLLREKAKSKSYHNTLLEGVERFFPPIGTERGVPRDRCRSFCFVFRHHAFLRPYHSNFVLVFDSCFCGRRMLQMQVYTMQVYMLNELERVINFYAQLFSNTQNAQFDSKQTSIDQLAGPWPKLPSNSPFRRLCFVLTATSVSRK